MKLKGHVKAVSQRNRNNRCCAVYSVTNSRGFTPSTDYFSKEIYSKDLSTYKLVEKGMIAYNPSRINVGSVALQDKAECVIVSPLYVVFCVDETLLCPEYVTYFLKSEPGLRQIDFRSIGTVRNNFTFDALEKMELRVPSVEDQLHVVSIIRRVESVIESTKQKSNQLDDLVKSRFVEMFGEAEKPRKDFPVKALNDVCSSIVRGPFGSAMKKEFFVPQGANTYKVYEQKHAIQKRADIGAYYITRDRFETLKRFECFTGDILMSCSGTMGEFYQLPPSCEPGVMNQALCKFTLSEAILSDYFLGFMEQVVDELGAKGSGIKNVSSVKYIKAIRIPLPPLELQRQFADFVTQVDKLRFEACYAMYLLCAAFTLL